MSLGVLIPWSADCGSKLRMGSGIIGRASNKKIQLWGSFCHLVVDPVIYPVIKVQWLPCFASQGGFHPSSQLNLNVGNPGVHSPVCDDSHEKMCSHQPIPCFTSFDDQKPVPTSGHLCSLTVATSETSCQLPSWNSHMKRCFDSKWLN